MNLREEELRNSQEIGKTSQGKNEFEKYQKGGKLSMKQAIMAHCYWCQGYYSDVNSREDCQSDSCPLYPLMPYRNKSEEEMEERRKLTRHLRKKGSAGDREGEGNQVRIAAKW